MNWKFASDYFGPRLVSHIPSLYLFWPDLILLLQPFLESEPDVTVELVKGFCRVDRPIVSGPSSNDRIDGLYLVHIVIVEGTPCGHRFDLHLHPFQPLVGGTYKHTDLATIGGFVAAKNAKP